MTKLKWRQVNAWRLAQLCLAPRLERSGFVRAASRAGGIQAQVMSAAEMSLWARSDGLTPRDVQSALWKERSLLKTWAMRGTLHLLPADELPLYVAARKAHATNNWARWALYFGMKPSQFDAFLACIPELLGAEPMTREQLARAVAKELRAPKLGKSLVASSWGMVWKPSAWRGELCFGPNLGRNVSFVNPRKWTGSWQQADPEQALREIARRYLSAYGPATAKEFAAWWGFGLVAARKVFASLDLEPVDVEGFHAFALRGSEIQNVEPGSTVNLLPLFDAYIMGIGRGAAIEKLLAKPYQKLVLRPQGWISAVVLVDGYVKGVWELKDRTVAAVRMFSPPSSAVRRGLEKEAARLSGFLGNPVELKA